MTLDTKAILEILGKLDVGFSRLESSVHSLKDDVSGLKEDVSVLKEDVSVLKEDVFGLKEDVSGLKKDVSGLKVGFYQLENRVNGLQMTLENETNRNIRIIAEGHLDLSRKLHEALKVEQEKEMLLLRVNALETEVRNIKNRLDQSA